MTTKAEKQAKHAKGPLWSQGPVVADDDGEVVANLTEMSIPNDKPLASRKADAHRVVVTWNAFHSPTRTIATENIPEGLVWKMHDLLKIWVTGEGIARGIGLIGARDLLASLKIEEPGQ